jgi:hypothetical protein
VIEVRQDLALDVKASELRDGITSQELDSNTLREVAFGPYGFVNDTHAAAADRTHDLPGAHPHVGGDGLHRYLRTEESRRGGEERPNLLRGSQQALHFVAHDGVVTAIAI